jgi:hypothetical protein
MERSPRDESFVRVEGRVTIFYETRKFITMFTTITALPERAIQGSGCHHLFVEVCTHHYGRR